MKRTNSQSLAEIIRDLMEENPGLQQKILEIRVERAWREILGPTIARYTRNVYVKDKTLHVTLDSAVLRSELTMCRDRLVKTLNEYARAEVLHDIIIR